MARPARSEVAEKSIGTRQIEVSGQAVTVYGRNGHDGQVGFDCRAGDRFQLGMQNGSDLEVITHWHGQVMADEGQDRTYTGDGLWHRLRWTGWISS